MTRRNYGVRTVPRIRLAGPEPEYRMSTGVSFLVALGVNFAAAVCVLLFAAGVWAVLQWAGLS
jgi:hypothetical protein